MSDTDRQRQDRDQDQDEDALFAEANAWFFRLQADDLTAAERTAFTAWLERGPAQARAWAEVRDLLDALKVPASAAHRAAHGIPAPAGARPPFGFRPFRTRRFAPAALALLLAVGGWGLWRGPETYQNLVADHATAVGEHRAVRLPDGSTADLNTDSAIALDFQGGERRVRLLRGEAWFQVTRDPEHPFVVDAGTGAARVLGTQFSVRRDGGRVTVTVGEGLVEVAALGGDGGFSWEDTVRVHPGQSVETGAGGLSAPVVADPGVAFAWRNGQVVFRQQPLASVIDALNRQWPGRVVLLNDEAADRVVSGVFSLDRPAAVFDALERGIGVRATRITPYLTLLR
ncbi:transmembrane sensor [Azospirillum agricola]|uniref:FecR family protein n=1 Tax=Azospirillum agricola TaxID=1720247 RepID=UPI001AE97093|nr:FecR family protein [Azospirillum agricola]MBP2232869.1 transmembrane sensor [Azospirillum agricola]